jgi:hypothetical protein
LVSVAKSRSVYSLCHQLANCRDAIHCVGRRLLHVRQDVRVCVEGQPGLRMAKHFLNDLRVHVL